MNSVIPQTRLDQIANIELSNVDKKTNEKEINVVLCNYVDVYKHWAITKANKKDFMIATAKDSDIKKLSLKKGQVAITKDSEKRDDIGISTYIADTLQDVVLGYHCALITPNPKLLNGSYLNAFFHTNMARKHFENQASGSGQRYTLTKEGISCIKIPLPKLEYQESVGHIFSLFDRKISLNNSIISKLEEMAKTIYEYWFLQFDFPNSEGKPYASSGGAMKYSEELGREIPINWEVIEIDKICKIYSGFAFKSTQYVKEGKYRLITIKNVQENGVVLEPANFIDDLPKKLPAYCLLEQGDILMSLTGNVGRVGLMFDDMCLLNQRVAKICPSDEEMRGLIYFLFKSTFVKSKMENMAGGTSQENLSPIETGKILIPYNEKIFRSFSKVANQWVSMIVKKQRENQKLTQLRDWLLPMLMNGQVRVE